MKKQKKYLLKYVTVFAAALVLAVSLCGCSLFGKNDLHTPQDAIIAAYGNREFKISFSSATLSEPIDPLSYTALSIPELPVPSRVGYIFQGWYYDADYIERFTEDSLHMKMRNVILYAKWVSEEFTANGIYDIHYQADLFEDSLVKGSKTDAYGGYADFADCLIGSEIYFEKSDDSLYLRLQYDNRYPAISDAFTVTLAPESGSQFRIATEKNIAVATETVRTVYIDWGENSIDTPLYLNVIWTNYKDVPSADIQDTAVRYTVRFSVTEFLGFSRSYVDLRSGMDDGYYSVRTYFKSQGNGETAMTSYQAVYAYLYLKDGNYTLITNFKPYAAFVGNGLKDEYYYNRLMTFAPMWLCYDLNAELPEGEIESEWYPGVYDAGFYRNMAIEYHHDERTYYHIIDLGSELKEHYMMVNTVTGMMELMTMGSRGRNEIIMTLDLDHILRLDESQVGYKPLSGTRYEWNTDIVHYSGSERDFVYTEERYKDARANGMQDLNINFFFSASGLNTSAEERRIYSHRIEITPTEETAAMRLSESRYRFAYFDVSAQIYGYDGRENLYADSYTTSRPCAGSGLRETVQIANGKSCKPGEIIDLETIYAEYFSGERSFSDVTYKAYRMDGYTVDFTGEITFDRNFSFEDPVAVEFFYETGSGRASAVFEFAKYVAPTVNIDVNNGELYDPDNNHYAVGQEIYIPYVTYHWMDGGRANHYIGGDTKGLVYVDGWYDPESVARHPMRSFFYSIADGKYQTGYTVPASKEGSFFMPSNDLVLVYELTNKYGEKSLYELFFFVSGENSYSIYEGDTEVHSGTLTDPSTGKLSAVTYREDMPTLYGDQYMEAFTRNYRIEVGGVRYGYEISQITVLDTQRRKTFTRSDYESTDAMLADACGYLFTVEYATVDVNYVSERTLKDTVYLSFLYNVRFGGRIGFQPLLADTVFTGRYYTLADCSFKSPLGVGFGNEETYNLYLMREGTREKPGDATSIRIENGQTLVYFNLPGTYCIQYTARAIYDDNGDLVFDRERTVASSTLEGYGYSLTAYYYFEVVPESSTVTVTLHTSPEHPFCEKMGGGTEYTMECDLRSGNVTLPMQEQLVSGDAGLMGWVRSAEHNARYPNILTPGYVISDFIGTFQSNRIDLYAVWDETVTVTLVPNVKTGVLPEEGFRVVLRMARTYDPSERTYVGFYKVDLDREFAMKINEITNGSSLEFKGYTGGFIGDSVRISGVYQITETHEPDYYVITAVFAKSYKVRFDLKAEDADGNRFTSEYYPYGQVYTGETVTLPGGKNGTPTCKIEGYEFKYWTVDRNHDGVLSEDEMIPFDLLTDVVTDDMASESGFVTLIAVFGKIGEQSNEE